MTAIEIDRATIAIGGKPILTGISLAIAEGEFIGVLGGNGAGKTTLLKAILGLLPPVAGSIRVFGRPAKPGSPGIGYLPQTRTAPGLRLSGYDLLASSVRGESWGVPWLGRADAAEIERVARLVGASNLIQRPFSTLSGGERQRVLLTQALIGSPRLLVLDEPLMSLDPRHQQAAVDLVRGISRQLGLAVLFTAHEINQVLPAVDRVLYLGNGSAALGSVDEVVTPATLSRIYGGPIEVVRTGGRIFALANGQEIERQAHDHTDHDYDHHHGHDDARL